MKNTRFISLILALILSISALAACGQTADPTPSDTTGAEAQTSTAADDTTAEPEQTVATEPLSTGDPTDFVMLVRPNRYHYIYTEEADGTPVANSVFARNSRLEKEFNMNIQIVEGKGNGDEN